MSSSTVDSQDLSLQEKKDSSLVKYKLRISLIFITTSTNQEKKARLFRQGKDFPNDLVENNITEDFLGSTIVYEDEDEKSGNYVIKDKSYIIYENSPKAMQRLSQDMDRYIKSFCDLSNVSEVIPCIFVPSFSPDTCIPKSFFHFFTPKCLLSSANKLTKLSVKLGGIFFVGVTEAVSYVRNTLSVENGGNGEKKVDKTLIQIFVLLSYYVYFYLDLMEQKDWAILKRDLSKEATIKKYLEEQEEKKNRNLFMKIIYWLFPITLLKESAMFFFNYDGHLKNRIYSRIVDVLKITGQYKNTHKDENFGNAVIIVSNILKESSKIGKPVEPEIFFNMCGYWQYYPNNFVREELRKWKLCEEDANKGFLTGYGALLFRREDQKQYIYVFKGTDFDSYARDWLLTNVLQGLTGFSGQHYLAVKYAKQIDQRISEKASLWFAGHSLGGGLASAATIATKNREGYTFNAAGLNVIGTTLNKLINNRTGIFSPSQCWNRVHPYRIKGEALDNVQKFVSPLILLKTLECGYGLDSVECDVKDLNLSSGQKHGIINFLNKEVMERMQPSEQITDYEKQGFNRHNKVIRITFYGKESEFDCKNLG